MKNYFILHLFIFFCFLAFVILSLNEKKISYADELYKLIKSEHTTSKVSLEKIKVKNEKFKISYIKIKKQDQQSLNNFKLPISREFLDEHKVINVVNNFNTYNHHLLIISSDQYFNNLKLIFSQKKINHKDVMNIFEDKYQYFNKYNEDRKETKYLLKKNQILNCKAFNDIKAKLKYCDKRHHMRIKNYVLPDIIFKTYKYFYFKLDDDYLEFSNV